MIFTARFFVVSEQPRSEEQKTNHENLREAWRGKIPFARDSMGNANCRNELPKRRAGCLHHKYSDMVELDPLVAVDRATGFPGVLPRPESEIMHKQRRGLQPGIAQ